jgi:uncharacterized protein (DUF302 family)
MMASYGFTKVLDMSFETVKGMIKEALKKEGFGILSEIYGRGNVREKLGIDFKEYVILGVCNLPYAQKAINAGEAMSPLLPYNVIVYEKDQGTALAIINPKVAMKMVKDEALGNLAEDAEAKLENVFNSIV